MTPVSGFRIPSLLPIKDSDKKLISIMPLEEITISGC